MKVTKTHVIRMKIIFLGKYLCSKYLFLTYKKPFIWFFHWKLLKLFSLQKSLVSFKNNIFNLFLHIFNIN